MSGVHERHGSRHRSVVNSAQEASTRVDQVHDAVAVNDGTRLRQRRDTSTTRQRSLSRPPPIGSSTAPAWFYISTTADSLRDASRWIRYARPMGWARRCASQGSRAQARAAPPQVLLPSGSCRSTTSSVPLVAATTSASVCRGVAVATRIRGGRLHAESLAADDVAENHRQSVLSILRSSAWVPLRAHRAFLEARPVRPVGAVRMNERPTTSLHRGRGARGAACSRRWTKELGYDLSPRRGRNRRAHEEAFGRPSPQPSPRPDALRPSRASSSSCRRARPSFFRRPICRQAAWRMTLSRGQLRLSSEAPSCGCRRGGRAARSGLHRLQHTFAAGMRRCRTRPP